MAPREYLELIVKPNVADAVQSPEDPTAHLQRRGDVRCLAAHLLLAKAACSA